MNRTKRGIAIASVGALVAASGVAAVAQAASDPATPPVLTRTVIDSAITGASFVTVANVADTPRDQEIVASAFGQLIFNPGGPPTLPAAGTVSMYKQTKRKNQPIIWEKTPVVTLADGITFPNKTTVDDVDLDGDQDIIVAGGTFFDSFGGNNRGSITWWESRGNGKTWIRHDVVTGSAFAYHKVEFGDFDDDGIADMVTVGEEGKSPSNPFDDIVALQFLKGLGGGNFAAPVKIGDGGGSLPVVFDVDEDGDTDVISAQYFGSPLPPPKGSFVWWERTGSTADGVQASDFVKRNIGISQGASFAIKPVPNLLGDGKVAWVGTNHTNVAVPPPGQPAPAMYLLTPSVPITGLWGSTVISNPAPGVPPIVSAPRPGQAAPGDFGYGDVDGDGDIDLAMSGDGDPRLFWVEQKGDGSFQMNLIPDSAGWGQAGGGEVVDLDSDGKNEIVFGSFDQNKLAIWTRS